MKKKNAPKNTTPVMPSPAVLLCEPAAKAYAEANRRVGDKLAAYQKAVETLRAEHLPDIKLAAKQAAHERTTLEALIVANKTLFNEPRTHTVHGVKFGLQKGKGRVEFDDPEKVVARIRQHLSIAQAALHIEVKHTPRKDTLATLDAATLKKLGVTITGTGDTVVVSAAKGEVEKLVAQILEEGQ